VWIAWVRRGRPVEPVQHHFEGDRATIREAAARRALEGLLDRLHGADGG
jgi:nicotinamide mononucleotide (NMN) deamidase PncC